MVWQFPPTAQEIPALNREYESLTVFVTQRQLRPRCQRGFHRLP